MHVLVTGGAGVVGTEVVKRLCAAGVELTALVKTSALHAAPHASVIQGDLRRAGLGLDRREYRRLARSIDRIVHIASVVDFNSEPGTVVVTNVNGVAGMVDLARASDADILYVSTAYTSQFAPAARVAGTGCATGRDTYLASKAAGDHIIADSGSAYRIVKPSIVIGDSLTGQIMRPQGLHNIIEAYRRGVVPFFPADEQTRIDFVPVDVLADAICAGALQWDIFGDEVQWLTAGDAAPTMANLMQWVDDFDGAGPTDRPVRFIPLETVQRLIMPAFSSTLDARSRHRLENMMALMALFTDAVMPSDLVERGMVTTSLLERAVHRAIAWASRSEDVSRSA